MSTKKLPTHGSLSGVGPSKLTVPVFQKASSHNVTHVAPLSSAHRQIEERKTVVDQAAAQHSTGAGINDALTNSFKFNPAALERNA